jgi:mRNA interferase RelE/StbE
MKIEFGTRALKFLSKLEKVSKERIFKRIKELCEDPFPSDVKKLKGEQDVYRIRIGDFRVLYRIISEDDVILIFRVDKRSRVYGR